MSLPKITSKTFPLELPSNNRKVTFRPFLVNEEKILLMARESGSEDEMIEAVRTILTNCTIQPENLNIGKLPLFDIEYYFLNLRAKSVGETLDFKVSHSNPEKFECQHKNPVQIDLESVRIYKDNDHKQEIMLTDDIGVKMRYLGFEDIKKIEKINRDKHQFDSTIDLIANSIELVFQGNEIYETKNYKNEEIVEFINNLNQRQINHLRHFFDTYPRLRHDINFTCDSCGKEDQVRLEGLESFFM